MRPQNLLIPFGLFSIGLVRARTLPYTRSAPFTVRDLFGLLGNENILPIPAGVRPPPGVANFLPTSTIASGEARSRTTSIETEKGSTSVHPAPLVIASTSTNTGFDTAFVVQTVTPGSLPDYSSIVSSSTVPATTGWIGDTSTTPPAELTEWKVIGIGVITVTLIAIIILSISFFDAWWGFVRSVICGKQASSEGEETMVPDWHRRSWEFRLANEDGHRYPTLSSLESIVKEKENSHMWDPSQSICSARITTPELAYGGK